MRASERGNDLTAVKHPIIVKNAEKQPAWMQTWQLARHAKNESNLLLATKLYQQLLQEKPNIEEARREYAHLLIERQDWQSAFSVLLGLLEINPDSQEYLFTTGKVALHLKRYRRAANYLGQVYTLNPNGANAVTALRGQIQALQKQNHKELAYPLMEQLYLLVPHEAHSIRELAKYSLELGQTEKAVTYYTTLLNEFTATDIDFLEGELLFSEQNNIDMAVMCWKEYLTLHPYHLPFHKKLAEYYLQGDTKEKALEHLLALVAHGEDRAILYLQIGQLYLYEQGRPDKALYYYDEYRKRIPHTVQVEKEIQRIQTVLANDLLVIVENEGAWNLWRDLAKVIPDRLAVYYSMVEQLQNLNKPKELREVLDIIHFHNPKDQDILLQLAELTFAENDFFACTRVLDSLDSSHRKGSSYFFLRGKTEEKNGNLEAALHAYSSFFNAGGNDSALVLHAMQIAGNVGDFAAVRGFYLFSQQQWNDKNQRSKNELLYGNILIENSLYTQARELYKVISRSSPKKDNYHAIVQERLVQILQEEGKYFEAEQELRFLLLKHPTSATYQRKLVINNLRAHDWSNAWKWHRVRMDESAISKTTDVLLTRELFIEKLSLLSQSGQNETAIEEALEFLQLGPDIPEIKLVLAGLYYKNRQFVNAQEMLLSIPDQSSECLLLLNLVEQQTRIVQSHKMKMGDYSVLIQRALQYQKYGANKQALGVINKYLSKYKGSLKGRVLKAQLLQSLGDDFNALNIFEELVEQYPNEEYFQIQRIKINFDSSKFANVIRFLDPDGELLQKESQPLTKQNVLLLARSYWAQKNQKKALAIYSEFLQPPVDVLFTKKLDENGIVLQLPEAKRSFLNRITFTKPSEPNRLRVVMNPKFTRENIERPEVEIATALYTEYRWQKFIQEELSVRQEMDDGNYYQAMKDYQKMLSHNPSMESLFDLAGIYSRLGYLGKEAALYRIIQEKSPGYPYLDEAMQRNSLKREPRISAVYDLGKKDGRDDYFDTKQQGIGFDSWYMPSLNHVLAVDYRGIYNQSLDKKNDLWRNRIRAELQWSPSYDLDVSGLIGIDDGELAGQTTLLYDISVKGKLGDMAEGFFRVSQDVVDDTLESLIANISAKKYEGGIQFDVLPRLFAGGNYQFTDYSDANYQNSYKLWSSYTIFPEPLFLELRYDYELSHNDDGNKKQEFNVTGIYGPDDHPYWSPKEYWQHVLSVTFEHQLTDDILGRGAPSYYSLGYAFGYENGGDVNHQFNAQIFLEISRHFLLNSRFEYIFGSEFEKLDSNISLIYRW